MYCKHCYYALKGLGKTGICPECGEGFDIYVYDSYAEVRPGKFDRRVGDYGAKLIMRFNVSCLVVLILFTGFNLYYSGTSSHTVSVLAGTGYLGSLSLGYFYMMVRMIKGISIGWIEKIWFYVTFLFFMVMMVVMI